jgi:hypothetical protein
VDWRPAGNNDIQLVVLGKDLEERDGIVDAHQLWVCVELNAKGFPQGPGVVICVCLFLLIPACVVVCMLDYKDSCD